MRKTNTSSSHANMPALQKNSTAELEKKMKRPYRMALSALFFTILASLLALALYPYINAFFGAFILYVIFRPSYIFLTARVKLRPSLAALGVMIITIMVVMIPLYTLLTIIAIEIQQLIMDTEGMEQLTSLLETSSFAFIRLVLNLIPAGINLKENITGFVGSAVGIFSTAIISAVRGAGKTLVDLVMMYLLLFYLLVGERSGFACSLQNAVPFNRENTRELLNEFRSTVRTILISTGVIALIQGTLLTLTFLLFGLEGAFLWGFMTFILSFIPALGPPIVWVPAAAIQLLQQDYVSAAGVFAGGIIVSSVDNLIRPAINKKVGQIHPLVSFIGVIIGLNLFGLLGIIIGPLLLSYTLLTARMFHEEYL